MKPISYCCSLITACYTYLCGQQCTATYICSLVKTSNCVLLLIIFFYFYYDRANLLFHQVFLLVSYECLITFNSLFLLSWLLQAELYRVKKEFKKAEPLYLEAINILEESFGPVDIRYNLNFHLARKK